MIFIKETQNFAQATENLQQDIVSKIKMATEFFMKSDNIDYPDKTDNWYCNEKFFKISEPLNFILKPDVIPSNAILSLFNDKTCRTRIDCGNATQLCWYKALLDIIGEKKFNEIFSYYPLNITQFGISDEKSFFYLISKVRSVSCEKDLGIDKRPISFGDECYIAGVKNYYDDIKQENAAYGEGYQRFPLKFINIYRS